MPDGDESDIRCDKICMSDGKKYLLDPWFNVYKHYFVKWRIRVHRIIIIFDRYLNQLSDEITRIIIHVLVGLGLRSPIFPKILFPI